MLATPLFLKKMSPFSAAVGVMASALGKIIPVKLESLCTSKPLLLSVTWEKLNIELSNVVNSM